MVTRTMEEPVDLLKKVSFQKTPYELSFEYMHEQLATGISICRPEFIIIKDKTACHISHHAHLYFGPGILAHKTHACSQRCISTHTHHIQTAPQLQYDSYVKIYG